MLQAAEASEWYAVTRPPEHRGLDLANRPLIHSLAWDVVLNATIPVGCYYVSKAVVTPSELTALLIATAFPTLRSIYDLTRHRRVNPVSILVLLGIVTTILALFVGGDPRLLLEL